MNDQERKDKIRSLNDNLRQTMQGGRVMMTQGILALAAEQFERLIPQVMTFDDFSENNDPHGEHDFGALTLDGDRVFWKIDYYDNDCQLGSPDPANPTVTTRVMTILLASEY